MLIVGIVLAALLVTVSSVSAEAEIWTDEDDYPPDSIVKISGSGFKPNTQLVQMDITTPNGAETDVCPGDVRCNGSALPTTDDEGGFLDYEYALNGVEGLYTVTVSDGTGNVTETTFTDLVWYLRVVDPNGGEMVSGTINVRFYVIVGVYLNTGDVQVGYSKNGPGGPWTSIGSVYVDHTGVYTIPWDTTGDDDGTNYHIGITDNEGGVLLNTDISDAAFCVCNGGSSVVLLDDGFDTDNWDDKWEDDGHNWRKSTNIKHSAPNSAKAKCNKEGTFTCDILDADDANVMIVSFWIRKHNTDSNDFTLYYYDDAGNYDPVAELDNLGSDNTWLHYTDFITDSQYFHSNFRIRFDATLDCGENVRVDDVVITKCTGGDPGEIPEFATIALPALSVLGLFLYFNRRKQRKE